MATKLKVVGSLAVWPMDHRCVIAPQAEPVAQPPAHYRSLDVGVSTQAKHGADNHGQDRAAPKAWATLQNGQGGPSALGALHTLDMG